MPVKSAVFFQWLNTMGKETTSTVGQTTTKDGKKVPPPKKGMVKTLIGLVGTLLLLIMVGLYVSVNDVGIGEQIDAGNFLKASKFSWST